MALPPSKLIPSSGLELEKLKKQKHDTEYTNN